jgi:NAD(P)H-dependent FMN reductase
MADSTTLKIALIVGSTRPNRFADVPARWVVEGAAERSDFMLEVLDLRDWTLPFFDQPASPARNTPGYSNPVVARWRDQVREFDAFIATVAEYNHGPTAVLKNALDTAYTEWNKKPIGFVGYGGVGGARAVEQLRTVAIELQMAPVMRAVHIGLEPSLGVMLHGKALDDYPYLAESRTAMFDQLVWWGNALKAARETTALATAIAV